MTEPTREFAGASATVKTPRGARPRQRTTWDKVINEETFMTALRELGGYAYASEIIRWHGLDPASGDPRYRGAEPRTYLVGSWLQASGRVYTAIERGVRGRIFILAGMPWPRPKDTPNGQSVAPPANAAPAVPAVLSSQSWKELGDIALAFAEFCEAMGKKA